MAGFFRNPFDLIEDDEYDYLNRSFSERFVDTWNVLCGTHWLDLNPNRYYSNVELTVVDRKGDQKETSSKYRVDIDGNQKSLSKRNDETGKYVRLSEERYQEAYGYIHLKDFSLEKTYSNDIKKGIVDAETFFRFGVLDLFLFPLLLLIKPISFLAFVSLMSASDSFFCYPFLIGAGTLLAIPELALFCVKAVVASALAVVLFPAIAWHHSSAQMQKAAMKSKQTLFEQSQVGQPDQADNTNKQQTYQRISA